MTDRIRETATYDDLEQVPDNMVAELIDGDLYSSPRPSGPHSNAMGGVFSDLLGAYQRGRGGPGGCWILLEPELHLTGETFSCPTSQAGGASECPRCLKRINSRSRRTGSARCCRRRRFASTARRSCASTPRTTFRTPGDDKVIAEPFPEVEIDVNDLWTSPLPPP